MQKCFDCGIDLGTTNSCIAIQNGDHGFEIIENQADRMSVTPSAVLIGNKGRMLIGQRAYNSPNTDDLVVQFKRHMGTSRVFEFKKAQIMKTPEELSSEILKRLRADAETRLNRPMENVVITVPAAFKTLQSEATNKAARMAGFKNVILLQEPIAAAVAYGAKPDAKDKYWMVFDYGGGTLDVAIVSTNNQRLEILNSEGDNYFGGSDLDRLIFEKVIIPKLEFAGYRIKNLFDENTPKGKSLVRKILLDCENCKIELSNKEEVLFELFDLEDDDGVEIELECQITRRQFEQLIEGTINKSIEMAKKALFGAKIEANQLDKILLVGGSTFIPLVKQKLIHAFNAELDSSLNPMTVVAAGAAIYASTSVIDVEEDITPVNPKSAILNLTYDSISSELSANVIGKITNIDTLHIDKVRIDCAKSQDFSGVCWTSGWMELLDNENGIFDIDVILQKKTLNHFKVIACNEVGENIPIENPFFDIKHNEVVLKTSAPPATMSIGVRIKAPSTGYDILDIVIPKNTPLPSKAERTYKTTKSIDPTSYDCIKIEIWEGENINNPEANSPAGTIFITSKQMKRLVPQGTEIEISIEADENRNINVNGYIPDFDYEIPSETLRPESRIDLSERLDAIEEKLNQTEVSISNLESQGKDMSESKKKLNELRREYANSCRIVNTNETAVNHYINDFYDFQSKIIEEERDNIKNNSDLSLDEKISEGKKRVEDWGDDTAKTELNELLVSYSLAQTKDEKEFIAEKIGRVGFQAMTNNFDWLIDFFEHVLINPDRSYTNVPKAEYWKSRGYEAIDSYSTSELRTAVFELLDLLTSSANQAIAEFGADLTI